MSEPVRWSPGPVVLDLVTTPDGPVRVRALVPAGADLPAPTRTSVPLLEVDCLGAGRVGNSAADQHRPYAVSAGLRHVTHEVTGTPIGELLTVHQHDPARGLTVYSRLQYVAGTSVVRVEHELVNDGADELVLTYASTLSLTGFAGADRLRAGLTVHEAYNAWCAELRWQARSAADVGMVDNGEIGTDEGNATSRQRHAVGVARSWSSGGHLPMGGIVRTEPAAAWVWQIEHPGSWLWEVGDLREDLYLQVSGPTEAEHHWRQTLRPGERYTTVGVAVAVVDGDLTDGLRALTAYRRILRRPSADLRELPVIFNDYMNCLMGDPTEDALAPLIDVAADVGCDTFVIDAGWYSDDPGWWDTVGAWQPSTARFPSGLATTTQRIRDAGMVPGLWLEPEVIGVHSPIADELPDDAFFQVGGERIAENGRYHLDFRCDAVRAYLDAVVDRLVTTYGLGYFKLDYNINLPGTDGGARPGRPESPGAGLVGHGRAYLAWLDGVLDRHPDLVLENCASGGMRMDYAILSRLQLQSTSDQRDHLRYAAIAAAAPSAVTPEQSAVWAYPQPGHSPEEATFCLVNALLGRIHLSGRIDRMDPAQWERVRQALRLYKEYRPLLATGLPYWPLGLPGWYDGWLALAIAGERECLLAVWCREPGGGERTLRLPWLRTDGGSSWRVVPAFPTDLPTVLAWSPQDGDLRIALGGGPAARLLRFAR